MESVSFDTLTFDHPAAAKPARVSGTLHLPMQAAPPFSCMVLLTSSAGVQRHREHYYAQALNEAGIAALSRRARFPATRRVCGWIAGSSAIFPS